MTKFLIDANLSYYFSIWNNDKFIHVKDINDSWTDEMIWNYAKENDLIIVSKDSDFLYKALTKGPPPKIIHIKFGNMKIKEFHQIIQNLWVEIEQQIQNCNILNIYRDRIESIK